MQGFIESGETWMHPLNEFLAWPKAIREGKNKRDGGRRSGAIGPSPFTFEARKETLRRLLALEKRVGRRSIEDTEIAYIQRHWSVAIVRETRNGVCPISGAKKLGDGHGLRSSCCPSRRALRAAPGLPQ